MKPVHCKITVIHTEFSEITVLDFCKKLKIIKKTILIKQQRQAYTSLRGKREFVTLFAATPAAITSSSSQVKSLELAKRVTA